MNINLTLFAQAVVFASFIWFTVKFVWPPLLRAIETRQKSIADGLAAAERGRRDLEQAQSGAESIMNEARARAQVVLAQAEKRAAEVVDEAKMAAREESSREKAAARAEIEQEVSRAREALRAQVADLVVSGAEKILRREVDAKAHADILSAVRGQL